MDQFKYILKVKEAKEAKTKKRRKALFNEAADSIPWYGSVTPTETLWFKIATLHLQLHHNDVYMYRRKKNLNTYAGKLVRDFINKKISETTLIDAFRFTDKMSLEQAESLRILLDEDTVCYKVKYELSKLVRTLDEQI